MYSSSEKNARSVYKLKNDGEIMAANRSRRAYRDERIRLSAAGGDRADIAEDSGCNSKLCRQRW